MVLGSAVAKGSIRSGLVSRETGALPKVYRRRSLSVNRRSVASAALSSEVGVEKHQSGVSRRLR